MYKEGLPLNNLQRFICQKTQPNKSYISIYMYEEDLPLNNLQRLICQKTQPNQILHRYVERRFGINNKEVLICHKPHPTNVFLPSSLV